MGYNEVYLKLSETAEQLSILCARLARIEEKLNLLTADV